MPAQPPLLSATQLDAGKETSLVSGAQKLELKILRAKEKVRACQALYGRAEAELFAAQQQLNKLCELAKGLEELTYELDVSITVSFLPL